MSSLYLAAAALALVLSIGDPAARPARAATLLVTTTADSGSGSLREAITTANATPGPDTITFAIPGSGVQTIQPLSALPTITDPVVIDGSSQPGHTDMPLIELSGASAGAGVDGLVITGGGSVVRALTINRFGGRGIFITGVGGNVVDGCFIGTSSDGSAAAGNEQGGVAIDSSPNNRVGGTTLAARNVVSGNSGSNIRVRESGATGNLIEGNHIGIDRLGQNAVVGAPVMSPGIEVWRASNTTIGGSTSAHRNIISGNLGSGIHVQGADGMTIQGNYIGTDRNGLSSVLNRGSGISIYRSTHVRVGGSETYQRNVISGHFDRDLGINGGGVVVGADSDVRIEGNYIGVASDGQTALPNFIGVDLEVSSSIILGGTTPRAGNIIAGNFFVDVSLIRPWLEPPVTGAILVQGNMIGLDAGEAPILPRGPVSIVVERADGVEIGGTLAGAANIIAGGEVAGVIIQAGRGARILGNSIAGGSGLAIDLGDQGWTGPTQNDTGDADDGANDLQNFPLITSVGTRGSATTVAGRLDSRPSTSHRVELFAGMANPPNGRGEPKRFLRAVDVTTDVSGAGTFAVDIGALAPGEWVSATATGPTSGTSEVSPAVEPRAAGVLVTPTSGLRTTEAGSTAAFTVALATVPSRNVVVPLASTNPSEGNVSPAALTFTPADALTPKIVTVRGADDAAVDGPKPFTVTLGALQSDDPTYAGLDPADVAVTNDDNDVLAPCSPRPPVRVSTVREGPGRLRVTVNATSNALTPDNPLTELRFRAPAGVEIDVAGTTGRTGTFTTALPDRPTTTTFLLRGAPSTPITVPFEVVDACTPPWSTFVGDGGR